MTHFSEQASSQASRLKISSNLQRTSVWARALHELCCGGSAQAGACMDVHALLNACEVHACKKVPCVTVSCMHANALLSACEVHLMTVWCSATTAKHSCTAKHRAGAFSAYMRP
eukprot:1156962-Pelagomonas_calceolata.AAC.12